MKKPVIITLVIITVLVGAAFAFVLLQPKDDQTTIPPQTNNEQIETPQTMPQGKTGKYQPYDQAAFETTAGRRLLFFHASWCPQCKALDSSIKKGKVPAGMTIFKVDYDTSSELKQKYGVTLQTTVVEVAEDGSLVDKFVAYNDPSLNAVLKSLGN